MCSGKTVDIIGSSRIDGLTREEPSAGRKDLLERIATARVEALRRIQDLPWYVLEKDDWHRDVDCVTPTSDAAPQQLGAIAARVKRSRTCADPHAADTAPARPGSLQSTRGGPTPTTAETVRKPAIASEAQQTQLTVALLLIEIQLDKLIELSREWQSA